MAEATSAFPDSQDLQSAHNYDAQGLASYHNHGDSSMEEELPLIVGVATVVVLSLALVVVAVLWRRYRKLLSENGAEPDPERADGIYVEISETGDKTAATRKGKVKPTQSDADNNNDPESLPMATLRPAPDIITAHDSDNIYETLDGRRAARAQAGHVTPETNETTFSSEHVTLETNQTREAISPPLPPLPPPPFQLSPRHDPVYDHLSRYKKKVTTPGATETRLSGSTPTSSSSPTLPPRPSVCRASRGLVRSKRVEDDSSPPLTPGSCSPRSVTRLVPLGLSGGDESPSSSLVEGSPRDLALSQLARQSCSGGRKIVCQLTMVGVVGEDGRPVAMETAPAPSKALFLLEPGQDGVEEGVLQSQLSTDTAAFRIRDCQASASTLDGSQDSGARPRGRSEYFVLESLDQEEEENAAPDLDIDLDIDLDGDLDLSAVKGDVCGGQRPDGGRCSLHGRCSVSSFRQPSRDGAMSARSRGLRSCSSVDDPPVAPSPAGGHVQRCLSSPNARRIRRRRSEDLEGCPRPYRLSRQGEEAEGGQKLDADLLKARIQREMRALGFLTGDETGDGTSAAPAGGRSADPEPQASEEQGPTVCSVAKRPPRNEYFILEPGASNDSVLGDDEPSGFPSGPGEPGVECVQTGRRPLYQRQASHGPPPRLPHRGYRATVQGHCRSRSETPLYWGDGEAAEGPVVVSLKKSKSLDATHHAASGR